MYRTVVTLCVLVKNKCQYLQSLYDRLVAGRVVLDGRSPQVQFTWPELTTMVAEQVSSALLEVQRLKNKVSLCIALY